MTHKEITLDGKRYQVWATGTVYRWSKVAFGVWNWKRLPTSAKHVIAKVVAAA